MNGKRSQDGGIWAGLWAAKVEAKKRKRFQAKRTAKVKM